MDRFTVMGITVGFKVTVMGITVGVKVKVKVNVKFRIRE